MRWAAQASVKAALVVTSVIASILLVELGLQSVGFMVRPSFSGLDYAPRFYYKADPVNGHDIAADFPAASFYLPDITRSFTVSSNSVGCRDRPFDGGNDYVLLLGDSYT